jgi:hypothetical protein
MLGAVPYLLVLAVGLTFCVRYVDRYPTACKLTGTSLGIAILTWFVRPWLAELRNSDFADYKTLELFSSFAVSLCSAISLGLLLWVVFMWPASSGEGRSTDGVDDPPQPFDRFWIEKFWASSSEGRWEASRRWCCMLVVYSPATSSVCCHQQVIQAAAVRAEWNTWSSRSRSWP